MDITDIIMIFAVFLGPIFAVQIQKYLEIKRESRNRKLYIFHTLMSTRATTLSQNHVTALNMIDIDFYRNKKVIDAWRIYYDHLNSQSSNESIIAWSEKCVELLVELLYTMAQYLEYDFDKVQLKRGCYRPMGHDDIESDQRKILKGLTSILDGKNAIPITFKSEHGLGETYEVQNFK